MQRFLRNKYVQAILVFFAVVGAYILLQNGLYYFEQDTPAEMPMNMEDMGSGMGMDYAGTHIMSDGTVMTGAGVAVPDAVIKDDGTIEMPDGTVVTPVGDFRP